MNGRVGADKGLGKYTFVGSKGSSVVDYVLSSQDLFKSIAHFEVNDPNIISVHCLITFSIDIPNDNVREVTQDNYDQAPGKFNGIMILNQNILVRSKTQ